MKRDKVISQALLDNAKVWFDKGKNMEFRS